MVYLRKDIKKVRFRIFFFAFFASIPIFIAIIAFSSFILICFDGVVNSSPAAMLFQLLLRSSNCSSVFSEPFITREFMNWFKHFINSKL